MRADCWEGTGLDAQGDYCDGDPLGDCDPKFLYCLRQYNAIGNEICECPLGRIQTGEFADSGDVFCFGDPLMDEATNDPNPIPNPIAFSNEGSYPVRKDKCFPYVSKMIFVHI